MKNTAQAFLMAFLGGISRRSTPAAFRAFLAGALGNVVGNMSDEDYQKFRKVEICEEPGCNCYEIQTRLVELLDFMRDDFKAEIAKRSEVKP